MPQSSNVIFSRNNSESSTCMVFMLSRCWINMPRSTKRRNKVFMLGAIDRPSADSACAIDRPVGEITVSIGVKVRINQFLIYVQN